MSTREARRRAVRKYQAANTKLLQIRLNFKTDADIIAHLETVSSKMGYVKKLIRDDMVNNMGRKTDRTRKGVKL